MDAQVLLSQEAWERLCLTMPAAGFPTVEQLGLFRLAAWPAPMWLYQARCALTHASAPLMWTAVCGSHVPGGQGVLSPIRQGSPCQQTGLAGEGEAEFNLSNPSCLQVRGTR